MRLVIPTPPPLWHSQRAATKYVGYWVGPSRKRILIGITWLNKHFYFYTYFKKKLLFHLAFPPISSTFFVARSIILLDLGVLTLVLLKTFSKLQFSKLCTYMPSLHYSCDLEKRLASQRLVCIGSTHSLLKYQNKRKVAKQKIGKPLRAILGTTAGK